MQFVTGFASEFGNIYENKNYQLNKTPSTKFTFLNQEFKTAFASKCVISTENKNFFDSRVY